MKKRKGFAAASDDFGLLEKIILREFEATEGTDQRRRVHGQADPKTSREAVLTGTDPCLPEEEPRVFHRKIRRLDEVTSSQNDGASTGVEKKADADVVSLNTSKVLDSGKQLEKEEDPGQDLSAAQEQPFDRDEEDFIARATSWLGPRDRKEAILMEIWERVSLAEAGPERGSEATESTEEGGAS